MPITELNHYFVRAKDIERSKNFYRDALGFEVMPRPNFPFPGYWLGVGGKVQVHMGLDGVPESTDYVISYLPQTGALHILYVCSVTRQAAYRLRFHYGDESCSVSTGPVFG